MRVINNITTGAWLFQIMPSTCSPLMRIKRRTPWILSVSEGMSLERPNSAKVALISNRWEYLLNIRMEARSQRLRGRTLQVSWPLSRWTLGNLWTPFPRTNPLPVRIHFQLIIRTFFIILGSTLRWRREAAVSFLVEVSFPDNSNKRTLISTRKWHSSRLMIS